MQTERHVPLHGEWADDAESPEASQARPSDETIAVLKRRGFLTELSAADERAYVAGLAEKRHAKELLARPQYILMPTYQCNLRCDYCFQDHMRTDPAFGHLLRFMTAEMVDRVVRAMDVIDANHPGASGRKRSITLFGGEPLLAASRGLIEYTLDRVHAGPGAEVFAITNGTELEAYLDLLGPDRIGNLQITIDGPPADHDRRRIYADGSGSFEKIADNVSRALERDVGVFVRVNVDKTNVEGLPVLAREIVARGWDRARNFGAYTAAVHATHDNDTTFNQYALVRHVRRLRESHPEMATIQSPSNEVERVLARILREEIKPWEAYKTSYCSAHNTMYVLDPFGDIYACWERTGDPGIRVGWIDENGYPHLKNRPAPTEPARKVDAPRRYLPVVGGAKIGDLDTWRSRTITTNETCAGCRYAFYCGGGCAAEAVNDRDGFFVNNCNGFQQKFRVAAAEAFARHQAGVVDMRLEPNLCGA